MLHKRYAAYYQQKQATLLRGQSGPQRRSAVIPSEGSELGNLGSYFKIMGLGRTVADLQRKLLEMEEEFSGSEGARFKASLQMLRLIAVPGMGEV